MTLSCNYVPVLSDVSRVVTSGAGFDECFLKDNLLAQVPFPFDLMVNSPAPKPLESAMEVKDLQQHTQAFPTPPPMLPPPPLTSSLSSSSTALSGLAFRR